MQPSPEPEPEPRPEAAPSPEARPSVRPAGENARGPAEAYTSMPSFEAPKKRWGPLVLALVMAAGAAGFGLRHRAPSPAAAPLSDSANILAYSQKDFDQETTASARAILARDGQTHELEVLDHDRRAEHARPAAPAAPSAGEQAALELAAAPQALRDQVSSGRAGFYTFQLAELVDEGGDVYDITVDGVPLLRITTSPQLKTITLPIDASKPHTVTQTLVFARPRSVYAKDGTGAPPPQPQAVSSLTIRTSEGEAASHLSGAGQSEAWTTQFRGSGQ